MPPRSNDYHVTNVMALLPKSTRLQNILDKNHDGLQLPKPNIVRKVILCPGLLAYRNDES